MCGFTLYYHESVLLRDLICLGIYHHIPTHIQSLLNAERNVHKIMSTSYLYEEVIYTCKMVSLYRNRTLGTIHTPSLNYLVLILSGCYHTPLKMIQYKTIGTACRISRAICAVGCVECSPVKIGIFNFTFLCTTFAEPVLPYYWQCQCYCTRQRSLEDKAVRFGRKHIRLCWLTSKQRSERRYFATATVCCIP